MHTYDLCSFTGNFLKIIKLCEKINKWFNNYYPLDELSNILKIKPHDAHKNLKMSPNR